MSNATDSDASKSDKTGSINYLEDDDDTTISNNSEEVVSDSSTEENEGEGSSVETPAYLRLRNERIARNHARLVQLGLVSPEGGGPIIASLVSPSSKRKDVSMTPTTSEPSPSVQTSRRKSPRLQQQVQDRTVDLAADDHPVQSSATPNMSNLTIEPTSGNSAEVVPPMPARRRLWNSNLARSINKIGKARKQRDVEEYGAMRIIHPSKLPTMKTRNGRLLDDSKELFLKQVMRLCAITLSSTVLTSKERIIAQDVLA